MAEAAIPTAVGPPSDKRRHDGKQGSVQEYVMMEPMLARENRLRAGQRVTSNAGAPGLDGRTVETFPAFRRPHGPRLRSALREGTYRPAPGRRVFIPKPDGTQRPLGVPTVLDRVIQPALAQGLTPWVRPWFQGPPLRVRRRPQRPSGGAARGSPPAGKKDAARRWTVT